MATYANATNPFIKTCEPEAAPGDTIGHGQAKQQVKKSAPGMARPLSLLDELGRGPAEQPERLLLDESPSDDPKELSQLDENNNSQAGAAQSRSESNPDLTLKAQMELLERDIDNEIAQTCQSLVEQAANVSLEGTEGNNARVSEERKDAELKASSALATGRVDPSERKSSNGTTRSICNSNCRTKDNEDAEEGEREEQEEEEEEEKVLSDIMTDKRQEKEDEQVASTRGASGGGRQQHIELIKKLRLQLRDLERYAHERGELERIPASVLLERQTVILETLRKKLPHFSLDRDKIEKLQLEELKRQVDDEINNLIDPLITKEHLLKQLQTQLTDLERYVSHLHGTIGITNGSCSPTSAAIPAIKSASCSCAVHGCSTPGRGPAGSPSSSSSRSRSSSHSSATRNHHTGERPSILSNDTLPKTSRLIRGLMAQLICSDIKIQDAMRMEKNFGERNGGLKSPADLANGNPGISVDLVASKGQVECQNTERAANEASKTVITTKPPQFHDGAAWTLHIDRVILASDSLTNLYTLAPRPAEVTATKATTTCGSRPVDYKAQHVDNSLVDSVTRRQLVPAIRDLLAYGLIDPNSLPPRSGYASFLFDPYYLLSSLTCLPGSQTQASNTKSDFASGASQEKVHVWHVIADYSELRNEPQFRNSSVKTLSQSFSLTSTMDGPIKITSKQALLIAVDDIIERLAKCKPNGPESHLKLFIYTALNQGKLATWIKLIFRNKTILRKYYHNFSFVCQPEKMDRFLSIIDTLGRFEFKLNTDTEAMDQFVSAF